MKPMRKLDGRVPGWVCVVFSGPADVGDKRGSLIGRSEVSNWVAVSRTNVRRGRSLEESMYKDGTCRLKATIMCPLLETGLVFSR